ncbi:MAG: DNA repair protein RecO [Bacilli bacterium]|nr:DNA repair protein RecO [Bacilli bacterium]
MSKVNVVTKGIVLTETPYGESSKILNILTENYGLIGVMSKGSRNIKNKLRGVSGKMAFAEFTISYKENGLSTLIEGNIINSFKNIFNDFKMASFAFYLMDLVKQVLQENNDKSLYKLLTSALIKINDKMPPTLISNIVELKLLDSLGVSLNLDSCSICGEDDIYTLDIKNGGVICKNCYTEGYVFNEKTIKLLKLLSNLDLSKITSLEITDEKIIQEIDDFISEYYTTYTGLYLRDKKKFNNITL